MSILIPVQNSAEVVEVAVSALPDDANDIVDILQAEMAPLDLWLKFAVEYYKQGKLEQFKLLLDPLVELEGQGALYDQFGNDPSVKRHFLTILNTLAAYHMVGATRERDKVKKKAGFDTAKKYYDHADVIDIKDGRATLGVAVLDLCRGDLVKAEKRLDLAAEWSRESVPAMLGQASVKYQMGQVKDALKLYRGVFRLMPTPPAPVRLGLAFCYSKLGQTELARRALERTLALQDDNVEALTALAVIHINEDRVAEALQLLKRAYELEPTHPAALNQLANHYFFKVAPALAASPPSPPPHTPHPPPTPTHPPVPPHHPSLPPPLHVLRLPPPLPAPLLSPFPDAPCPPPSPHTLPPSLPDLPSPFPLPPQHIPLFTPPTRLPPLARVQAQHAKAQTLAKRAYQASASPAIRAEACFHMARTFHAQGDHSSALQWYTQSSKEKPDYAMPLFGLGQMHLINNDPEKAVRYFERTLRHAPDNVDTLRVLGHLYAASDRHALALQKLQRATELAPDDVGAWLELAKLHETREPPTALAAFESAAALLKKSKKAVPLELWNNIGALRHQLGKLDTAEKAYRQALAAARAASAPDKGKASEGDAAPADPRAATISFNLARLHEQRGERSRAVAQYKELLREHPTYLDCYLRLSACARADGQMAEAVGWLKRGLEVDPAQSDAWCALGALQMERKEWVAADACFRHVLTKCEPHEVCKRDAYANLSLANIQLATAKGKSDAVARLDKATEMYRSVLQHEPNNVYAANGLGIVCVEKGRLQEAREIFTVVREAAAGCDHALLNLAQVQAAQAEHTAAVAGYQKAQKKGHGGRSAELWLLEARAHFEAGKLAESRRALVKAVHLQPADLLGWHHLTLVVLRQCAPPAAGAARSVEAVAAAREQLSLALRLCEATATAPEAARKLAEAAGLDASRVAAVADGCAAEGDRLATELEAAQRLEAAQAEERRVAEERSAALLAERQAERQREEAAKTAAREREEELVRQKKAQLAEKLQKWGEQDAQEAERDARAAEGRRKRKARGADGGDDSDDDVEAPHADGADGAGGAGEEPEADDADLFGSDDDDDDANANANGGAKADADEDLFGDDDDDDAGAGAGAAAASKPKAAEVDAELDELEDVETPGAAAAAAGGRKRRKIVDEDDSDDDAAPEDGTGEPPAKAPRAEADAGAE